MKLGKLASLKTGLVLTRKRASIKYEVEKNYRVVKLNNIDDAGFFNNEQFESFESNEVLERDYFTEEGDVLIRLSSPHTAVYVDGSKIGLLVPSSLAIIKVNSPGFTPEYVAWFLNSQYAKKELMRHQTGTAMGTTNIAVLSEIDVQRIPLRDQDVIGKIHELHSQESALLRKLVEEKEKYYQEITTKLMSRKGAANDDENN